MTFQAINDAIRTHANSVSDDIAPIWWADEYQPPVDRPHVRWSSLISSVVPMEVGAHLVSGDNPPDETRGFVQFDIYVPSGIHPRDGEVMADAIRAHFRGAYVPPVQFETPRLVPVQREGDRVRMTIEIPFKAENA